MSRDSFTISSRLRRATPRGRFHFIKKSILGDAYVLSLVFVGETHMRRLNHTYRKKDYATDVLSFSLSPREGEIYLCPEVARKKCADFSLSPREYLSYIFIHGCLHLKGYAHGKKMETLEKKYATMVDIKI